MNKTISNFKSVLLLLSMVSAASANAQTKWNYTYDATGNRTQRAISTESKARQAILLSTKSIYSDGKTSVRLANGGNRLKIESLTNKEMHATVYDLNGVVLMSNHTDSQIINFDISSLRRGIYILSIELDNEKKTCKFNK